ncbi:MAG: hypothetical protein HQ450_08075 [Alcaligenaceae bacterium]|nr:hypothetical protein [Alcaligenaceae bacterium]
MHGLLKLTRFLLKARPFRAFQALCVVLVLSGCSSLQIAYNYAPNYLAYRLNGYFSLDDAQKVTLDLELQTFIAWHAETALPDYTRTLETWQARVEVATPFTVTEVLAIQQQVELALEVLGQRAASQLAGLLVTLTPKQQLRLKAEFESENKDYFNEFLKNPTSEATRKNHYKRALKRYEDWLGALTKNQEKLITELADKRSKTFAGWGDERTLRQKALLDLLEQQRGKDAPQAEAALRVYLYSLKKYREPTLAAQQSQIRQDWAQVTAEVLNSLTPEQKTYLKKKLGVYAQDFASLTPKRLAQGSQK